MAERPTPEAVFRRWRGGVGGVKPTVFYGAPTGFAGMLASNALPGARGRGAEARVVRRRSAAGRDRRALQAPFGVDIVDGIGSTEMLHIFISNRPDKVRYGTTGWPVPGYEIELRGEDGRAVPDGEPGELYIHGPSAALMYWGNRAKTRDTFQGGWTRSGDKYIRNADGSFTYAGRSDDMLKVGGIWVSPFEVEATLVQHPSVLEAAVDRRARRRRPHQDQGLRRAEARATAADEPSSSTSSRTASPRTNTRAPSSSSTSCRRPRPARSSASACASGRRAGGEGGCPLLRATQSFQRLRRLFLQPGAARPGPQRR